jgi:hypothetical protein
MNITGKIVVLRKGWFADPERAADVRERLFRADGGFGCNAFTMGTAVVGEFVVDGERVRIEGYDVKRLATQEEIGAARLERARREGRS